jgi:hypothetical protein
MVIASPQVLYIREEDSPHEPGLVYSLEAKHREMSLVFDRVLTSRNKTDFTADGDVLHSDWQKELKSLTLLIINFTRKIHRWTLS